MVSEAPPFWWEKPGIRAGLLTPFSWIYGHVAARIMDRRQRKALAVPVICVGNFTVGGSGKTPTALALADEVVQRGLVPGFLSRGYGGAVTEATVVDRTHHTARSVGDEPMLLARKALTVVSADRLAGGELLVREGAEVIIMDDGFQSARLVFDYALMVVDARRGIGNGRVLPAGPVRAPLVDQIRHSDSLLVIGRGEGADRVIRLAARAARPVHTARLAPQSPHRLMGKNCLAFAGIGDPEKFFATLEDAGVRLANRYAFADHHMFSEEEIASLLEEAAIYGLYLVTTAKDAARLAGRHGRAEELAKRSDVLEVKLEFDQDDFAATVVSAAIAACRRRLTGA